MSQRVAGCCCSPPCDPTLGACCTKVGGVCGCIADKTLCECTKLGGTWSANNLCPVGCWGSCCKYSMSNAFINCTNNVTECACAAMATAGQNYTKFHRGLTCANNPCSRCLQTQTCQTNRIFNVATFTNIYTYVNNTICACNQGQDVGQNTRQGSIESSINNYFSPCAQYFTYNPFITWYDDDPIDFTCFSRYEDVEETNTYDCDVDGGLTGTSSIKSEFKFVLLARITVPPCGAWLKAGTFVKDLANISSGCACFSGKPQYDKIFIQQWCWPYAADFRLHGCNCNLPYCTNFDAPNPYGHTTTCERYIYLGNEVMNGCSY